MELFAEKRILTVSQLTALVKDVLEENFEHVWVEGEVSNLVSPQSGHVYFTLKDAGSQLKCVLFRAAARSIRFRLKDGMRLIVRGRVTVFAQRGDYQLIVEYLEPQGIGALQLAFLQLKERLATEGLFSETRKRPIPPLPQRIGVVTSPTGAAIHDILTVLDRRFANLEVLLIPVKVQGEGAAAEIASAIKDFNTYRVVDVLIVGRGGGSIEDLWAFNEEVVARAIAASRIPVISAVGHEIDFTIADLVADLRAPTPSAAAELVVASKAELTSLVEGLQYRLERAVTGLVAAMNSRLAVAQAALRDPAMRIGQLGQRLDFLQERMATAVAGMLVRRSERISSLVGALRFQSPVADIEHGREVLQGLVARMDQAVQRRLDKHRELLARRTGSLEGLSPLATLARGYSIVQRESDGKVIRSADQLSVADRLNLRLHRGTVGCVVETVNTDRGSA